jgi:hypothetical protein
VENWRIFDDDSTCGWRKNHVIGNCGESTGKNPAKTLQTLEGSREVGIIARNCEIRTAVDIWFDIFSENSIRQNGRRTETKFTAEKFFRQLDGRVKVASDNFFD